MTIIRNCVSLLGNASTYCFENCVQTFTNILTMARQKRKLLDFLHTALRKIFWYKVREVLEESVGKKKKERPMIWPKVMKQFSRTCLIWILFGILIYLVASTFKFYLIK